MQTIILALISLFGPVLVDALKRWLESLFQRSASRMPNTDGWSEDKILSRLWIAALDQFDDEADSEMDLHNLEGKLIPWWNLPARVSHSVVGSALRRRLHRRRRLLGTLRGVAVEAFRQGRTTLTEPEAQRVAADAEAAI